MPDLNSEKQKPQGYTATDNTERCMRCAIGDDHHGRAGTPLINQTIRLNYDNKKPFIDIADVRRCPKCSDISGIRVRGNAASKYGFTILQIENCLRRSVGDMILKQELESAPTKQYNANQFTEQEDIL